MLHLLPGTERPNTATRLFVDQYGSFAVVSTTAFVPVLTPVSQLTAPFPYPSFPTFNSLSPALAGSLTFNSSLLASLVSQPHTLPLPHPTPCSQLTTPANFPVPPPQSSHPGSLIPVYLLSLIPSQDHRCFSRPFSLSHSFA